MISRLKKVASLQNLNLNSNEIKVKVNEKLDEQFSYKLEQAYLLISLVLNIGDVLSNKEDINEEDLMKLKDYLQSLNQLDSSCFLEIESSKNNLQALINLIEEYNELWNQYQSLIPEYQKNPDDENIKNSLAEIAQKMFLNEDFKINLNNLKYYFTGFFMNINENIILNLYNENGEYYASKIIDEYINSNRLKDFVTYCQNYVNNKPSEIKVDRRTYIKEYLLKDILKDKYDEYMQALEDYLHSSNRDSLMKIVEITVNNPDLLELNKIVSGNPDKVYRGLSFWSEDDVDYQRILYDKDMYIEGEHRYVSTSKIKSIAKQFANSKSEGVGLVLTIRPGTIIYCSEIAGGVFGESEIIIDMQDSEILDVEKV